MGDAPLSRALTPDEVAEELAGANESLPLAPRVSRYGEPGSAAGGEEHASGHQSTAARIGPPAREPLPSADRG